MNFYYYTYYQAKILVHLSFVELVTHDSCKERIEVRKKIYKGNKYQRY
jgi:hypothetical protein